MVQQCMVRLLMVTLSLAWPMLAQRSHPAVAHHDSLSLAKLVALALPGWNETVPSKVRVHDVTGKGGSSTFKLVADGFEPHAVALHIRDLSNPFSDYTEQRMAMASFVFSQAGAAPRRLAEGPGWFIERWEGEQPWMSRGRPSTEELKSAAKLLAHIHNIPTDWFTTYREQVMQEKAMFREAPLGSHAWMLACRLTEFDADIQLTKDEHHFVDMQRLYVKAGIVPQHPLAARVVTCHGDLHPGNYILDGSVMKCIDLEFAHVGYAVHDLAWFLMLFRHEPAWCRTFFEEYLRCNGYSAPSAQDVDSLLLEAEFASLRFSTRSVLWTDFRRSVQQFGYVYDWYRQLEAQEERVRANRTLRTEIIDNLQEGTSFSNSSCRFSDHACCSDE